MRRLFFVSTLIILASYTSLLPADTLPQLSKGARVSLLTCSPGKELYSLFGHCAIRIEDTDLNIDRVYNYGTFDFQAPNFYLNFIRGKLLYYLSVSSFRTFTLEYIAANRGIIEQELTLTQEEKQLIFIVLENNYLPQNRHYLYHYFLNNCATKIWEVIIKALTPIAVLHFKPAPANDSFRQLIAPYLKNRSWLNFGLHLCLGLPCDRKTDTMQRMFLPDLLKTGFQNASIQRRGGSQPLVRIESIIAEYPELNNQQREWLTPNVTLWILLAGIAMVSIVGEWRGHAYLIWLDRLLFFTIGLVGFFLTLLWAATDHDFAGFNLNLLWALPFHLIFVFRLRKKATSKSTRTYFLICGLLSLLLLATWPFNPQTLHSALIPLLFILAYRCMGIAIRTKG